MGMFDSIQCNYPLPLPLEVLDYLPDIYEQEFQTKDLENLLDNYILTEDGELLEIKKKYKWKDDENSFLKGYMEVIKEEIVPTNFHGMVNFYCYETVYEDSSLTKSKDISIDYLAKFTNGKLSNIELLTYEIVDSTNRILNLKNMMEEHARTQKRWYNKYIFNTKYWKFFKWHVIIAPINFIKKICDKLYWVAVRYL